MALKFNKLEAVQFGDIVEVPVLDQEKKLRLKTLTRADSDDAKDKMSACFPQNQASIREFMNEMSDYDLQRLFTYLVHGESGLELTEKMVSQNMESVIKEKLNG